LVTFAWLVSILAFISSRISNICSISNCHVYKSVTTSWHQNVAC
jgi:hypothetical protein